MSTFKDFREDNLITIAEITKIVKMFLDGMAPELDEILLEMLKAPNVVGLSWLTPIFIVA